MEMFFKVWLQNGLPLIVPVNPELASISNVA
jgi:hypothetical protein